MLTPTYSDFQTALVARNLAAAWHLPDPNVTGIDVGYRLKGARQTPVDELTVRVHLRYKPRGEEFEAFAAAHPGRVIRESKLGHPVDIVRADYRGHSSSFGFGSAPAPVAFPPALPSTPGSGRFRPLQGGISVCPARLTRATLGGIVRDRQTGAPMILSNWHALSGMAFPPIGQAILQPGPADRGTAADTVAHFTRDAMNQNLDAAVAALEPGIDFTSEQLNLGATMGPGEATLGMPVIKSGATSGITRGIVTGVGFIQQMNYGGLLREIRHGIHIAPDGTPNVSSGGDSGSFWLEESTRRVVGLHYAGSDQPDFALALSMPQVLEALQVDLV